MAFPPRRWLAAALFAMGAAAGALESGQGLDDPNDWIKDWPRPDLKKMEAYVVEAEEMARARREGVPFQPKAAVMLPMDFYKDVIWLRENPDRKALPMLIRWLRANRGSGSTSQYSAAQALFASGAPEAHEAIAEAVGEYPSGYEVLAALRYADHFGMRPGRAEVMHRRHHLAHNSKAFRLSVTASKTDGTNLVALDVDATNLSGQERSVWSLIDGSGVAIVLENMENKRLLWPDSGLTWRSIGHMPEPPKLPPNASQAFHWKMPVRPGEAHGLPKGRLVLETGLPGPFCIDIGRGGEFRFWVIWETPALWEDYPEADREAVAEDRRHSAVRLFERSVAVSNPVIIGAR